MENIGKAQEVTDHHGMVQSGIMTSIRLEGGVINNLDVYPNPSMYSMCHSHLRTFRI